MLLPGLKPKMSLSNQEKILLCLTHNSNKLSHLDLSSFTQKTSQLHSMHQSVMTNKFQQDYPGLHAISVSLKLKDTQMRK